MEETKWILGEKIYRYCFDLSRREAHVDEFEITDVTHGGILAKATSTESPAITIKQGAYFRKDFLGQVWAKGSNKYVTLGENDPSKAIELILSYISKRFEELDKQRAILEDWKDLLIGFRDQHVIDTWATNGEWRLILECWDRYLEKTREIEK